MASFCCSATSLASELLVATRSAHKLAEIRDILAHTLPFKLVTLTDLGIPATPAEDDIEAHDTFLANAIAKALYFADLTGLRTLADDSGIMVDALGGGPGVRTKRFALDHSYVVAGTQGIELDRANNRLLLDKLAIVRDDERGAHYVCAAALADRAHIVTTSVGTCSGRIAYEERGSAGFGYDPLFEIPDLDVTFAQLTAEQKNQRSHRAIAFRALASTLSKRG